MTRSTTCRQLLVLLAGWVFPVMAGAQPLTGELGRIGPPGDQVMMLGVGAPGFEDLSPRERALAYMLNRAAIAGDRIFTQQNHREGLDLYTLLNEVDLHNDVLQPAVAAAVREELLRLVIHHGPHDQRTHKKHARWALTPSLLAGAVAAAEKDGARLPRLKGESTDAMLARLTPLLLDGAVEPVHVEQGRDRDIVAGSAVNLYAPGVTAAMVDGLLGYWQQKINVRFDLRDGQLMMQPYKIGGLYSDELKAVSHWLRKALPLAENAEQKKSIHALLDFYATGDEALFREHSVHWLKADTKVDYVNGFVETYLDPRGVVGSFEANVSFSADSVLVKKLAQAAPSLEERMPWDKAWKRTKVTAPVANVVNVVMETGDAGPVTAAAYNLPNYNDIRRDHGSKNVVLLNIELARSEDVRRAVIQEFYPVADRQNAVDVGAETRRWMLYMHEVIGHGSGQPDPSLKAGATLAGRTYAALEECRADMVALYMMSDPKLLELGAFASKEQQEKVARDAYVSYVNLELVSLRADQELVLREAHRRGHHLVTEFLLQGGLSKKDYGVKKVTVDGKTFFAVNDVKKARAGVGDLLALLQKYKSTADDKGATDLFERFGTHIDPALREESIRRAEPLNIPRLGVFAFPRMVPVVQDGQVVDARLVQDEDLLMQARRIRRIWADPLPEGQ